MGSNTLTGEASADLEARAQAVRGNLRRDTAQIDEIGALYNAYVASGSDFPLDLEEHSLELILELMRPDDLDILIRLETVKTLLNKHVPPTLPERIEALLPHVEDAVAAFEKDQATPEMLIGALRRCEREGRPVPLLLEIGILHHHLANDPSRVDLKRRLHSALREANRPIPNDLARDVRQSYIDEEYETDFQKMMAEYGAEAGYKDLEDAFFEDLASVRRYTMTSVERLYALWDAVRYVARAGLDGDFVEAGVWRGGSVMLMALALKRFEAVGPKLWLYDTFAGLPKPDETLDVDILGNRAIDGWRGRDVDENSSIWAYADETDVRNNLGLTGYPEALTRFVPGKVEDTIPGVLPERISLLRVDTDWHASYKHALPYLYDRVVRGGVIFFDDYGQFLGARRAVDAFITERSIATPLIRIDFSCRMMIKL